APVALAAPEEENQPTDAGDGEYAAGADEIHDGGAVLAFCRVVMEAEEQYLVHGRADLVVRRFDQAEAQIPRLVLNVGEVARKSTGGREHHDATGVGELVFLWVIAVMETDGAG